MGLTAPTSQELDGIEEGAFAALSSVVVIGTIVSGHWCLINNGS